ncbi:MAG TPA: VWA domain-containing protein [Vicinamibacterales bacterium]|nr:VWA domain-containing protein [Vicinamibacterales bacterium]
MAIRRLLAASLAVSVAVAAQASSAAQSAPEQPVFKSGVDLVRFDVRIVDDAGRPIADLTADDIQIDENGTPLPVMLFQRVVEPAESYVEAAIRAVSAEVSSNEAFPRGHLYIIVFDQQHITPGNEQRARQAAEQFIRRRVRPTDRVALFAIPGPGPQIGFTADKALAIQELSAIRGNRERVIASALGTMTVYEAHRVVQGDDRLIQALMTRMASDATTGGADLLGTNRTAAAEDPSVTRRLIHENARALVMQSDSESRQFLQRLSDVIAGFRDIEGRKTVVLFSEGFFQDNLSRELEEVAAAAAQSYCVFHTFDVNSRGVAVTQLGASETTLGAEIQARIAPLATLAVETDGMMVVDAAARSEQALDAIADQAQEYYLVGFTPSQEARVNRGKYRRVTIRVKRPGARVSARTGYAVAPETTVADRRRAIDRVLGAPFVQQALKIDYTTYVTKASEPGHHRVVLSLAAQLPVRSRPGDAADVVFVARDVRDGRVVASGTDTIPLPPEPARGAALGTGTWRVQFNVPAGSYLMRTVVREPGGLVGSADRRVEVRPLDGPDVTVSDLVLGSALAALPVRPRAYTGDGLTGVIEAYGRTAVQLQDLRVAVELRRLHDGTSVGSLAADLQDLSADGTGASRRAIFRLPLAGVPPGDYLARAVVTARGEIVGERTRQVEVLEGRAAATAPDAAEPALATLSPIEVVRGDLAQQYLGTLLKGADGTPAYLAARRATEGRWEEAEALLRRLRDEAGVVAHALRGFALFVREDFRGAAAALEEAFAADPQSALTAFFLGWAHDGAGDPRAALSAWRSAAHLDPSLVSAHLALAEGYLRLSQPALAVQALKAGLAKLPSSPELQARLQQIERIQP